MERIKPALHVRGNIVIESESTPKMGGGINPWVSDRCVDLSEAIIIEGDLHLHSLDCAGHVVTCTGELCCYGSPSEGAASW